jgi:predicted nucleic acid-binding protein
MKAAADTNILVYASGENDSVRQQIATTLLAAMYASHGVLPAQTLAELHRVLTRKFRRSPQDAAHLLNRWSFGFEIAPTTDSCLANAASLSSRHGLQIFDAIIIAASAEAGCRVLFSEDMQHEAVFNGVTIINPFADEKHPMLLAVLKRPKGEQAP